MTERDRDKERRPEACSHVVGCGITVESLRSSVQVEKTSRNFLPLPSAVGSHACFTCALKALKTQTLGREHRALGLGEQGRLVVLDQGPWEEVSRLLYQQSLGLWIQEP